MRMRGIKATMKAPLRRRARLFAYRRQCFRRAIAECARLGLPEVLQLFLNSQFLSFQFLEGRTVSGGAFLFGLDRFIKFAMALGEFFNPALN